MFGYTKKIREYESPIKLFEQFGQIDSLIPQIEKRIQDVREDYVHSMVVKTGIAVDKEELLKALQYDRGQYEKGYADGRLSAQSEGEWEKHLDEYDCEFAKCSHCGEEYYDANGEDTIDMFYNFCPNCGAKMKGGEQGC